MIYKRLVAGNSTWEVTLAEKRVRVVDDDVVEELELPTVERAQHFVADRVRQLTELGYREDAYEESYEHGLREPALEAAIAAAPDDPEGYLVYADWLQQRGEPRGELIVLQHELLGRPRDKALRAREAELFDAHSDRLLGPLALVGNVRAEWFCGFVRSLEMSIWLQAMGRTIVRPLLQHPSLQFLVRFAGNPGNDTDITAFARYLPATLEELELLRANHPQTVGLQRAFRDSGRDLPRLRRIIVGYVRARSVAELISAS